VTIKDEFNGLDRMQMNDQIDTIKLEQELAVERERYLRLAADFDNYRKRTSRELQQRAASQKEALVRDLLPAVDNMERALAAKIQSHESLFEGVKMVHQQVLEILKRHGFEPRDDLGQPFDGRFHDGIAVGAQPDMPDLSIIEVWERGWMRGAEMFRPAKVLVNNLSEEEFAPSEQKEVNAL
jgi:molecular chaperone GrpE